MLFVQEHFVITEAHAYLQNKANQTLSLGHNVLFDS